MIGQTGRSPSVLEGFASSDLSFHSLGGRDTGDPLSKITVALSPKGWHCPECLHISTTKGNLKSHILSGRHKLFEKSFMCSFCRKTYSTRQSLQVLFYLLVDKKRHHWFVSHYFKICIPLSKAYVKIAQSYFVGAIGVKI